MVDLMTKVAGVSFIPGYPRNLVDLASRCEVEPVRAELVRDLDNAHDLNAVAVEVEGRRVGFLPAHVAVLVAPDIDRGMTYGAEVSFVAVDLEHRERPGLRLRLFPKEDS